MINALNIEHPQNPFPNQQWLWKDEETEEEERREKNHHFFLCIEIDEYAYNSSVK